MSEKTKVVVWEIVEWVVSIAIALAIALLLRTYVFTLVEVSGSSMENTLEDKQRLFVYRWFYEPENGDIVVFDPPNDEHLYIKRVIATEGQSVYIDYDNNLVYVDDVPIYEPYIKEKMKRSSGMNWDTNPETGLPFNQPQIVPENCVFCLGDNRNNSKDSRYSDVGYIKESAIMGKATWRLWPFNKWGSLY